MNEQKKRPVIGVIQWDCSLPRDTYFGSWVSKTLSPAAYRDRIPFYAEILGDGTVTFHRRNVAEFEEEMRYAVDAGIDYFAYCWYGDDSEKRLPPLVQGSAALVDDHVHELTWARKLHMQSKLRHSLKLCAILSIAHPYTDAELIDLARQMRDGGYQTMGDRPLLYLYGNVQTAVLIRRIRRICAGEGTKDPYVVFLLNEAPLPEELEGLADGVCAYATVKGSITEYSELVAEELKRNESRLSCKAEAIPHFTVGWAPRPRIDNPVPWVTYEDQPYLDGITPEQYREGAREMKRWLDEHEGQCREHILTFAWNEFEEGGWICPTKNPDGTVNTEHLDAFARTVKIWRGEE